MANDTINIIGKGITIRGSLTGGGDLVIEGRAKLLGLPEFRDDLEGMKGVVSALDEHERIVGLLDATLAATPSAVVVGSEAGDLGGGQLSIVGATYRDKGRTVGAVGVIGSTRMDYPKVLPLVEATASAMTAFMGRSGPVPHPAGGSDDDDDG